MTFRLGKNEAVRPPELRDFIDYHPEGLAPPPSSCHYGTKRRKAGWGMYGNDSIGDCTIASAGHLVVLSNDELATRDVVPTTVQVEKEYLTETGGSDTGLVIVDVLKRWNTVGFFGTVHNKIAGYAPIPVNDTTQIDQAIYYYGSATVGIQLPESAQDQFPGDWTVVAGSPIEGGHDVLVCGYDDEWYDLITWGTRIRMSKEFWVANGDEAWCVLSQEDIEHKAGPSGMDVAALTADLAKV